MAVSGVTVARRNSWNVDKSSAAFCEARVALIAFSMKKFASLDA